MYNFRQLINGAGLRGKLGFAFLCVGLISVGLGSCGYIFLRQSAAQIEGLTTGDMPSIESLLTMSLQANVIKTAQRTLLHEDLAPAVRERQYAFLSNGIAHFEAAQAVYTAAFHTAEEETRWQELNGLWEKWKVDSQEAARISRQIAALQLGPAAKLDGRLARFGAEHARLRLLAGQPQNAALLNASDCGFAQWTLSLTNLNPALRQSLAAAADADARFHQALGKIKAGADRDAAAKELDAAALIMDREMDAAAQILAQANALQENFSHQVLTVCRDTQLRAEELLAQLVEINEDEAMVNSFDAQAHSRKVGNGLLIAAIAGFALTFLLAIIMTRAIARPLIRATESVDDSAEQVASAARLVSANSESLSASASQQAASLEETSASLEEIGILANQNDQSAQNARDLALLAKDAAHHGSEDVIALREAADSMSRATKEISAIVKTIDEIAFQTNILALNAAVEAARAGGAGAGFAVVAEEVRNLAQRCALAARETTEKIDQEISSVNRESEAAVRVETRMRELVNEIDQLSDIVTAIAQASKEQGQGIGQIVTAAAAMDQVTQSTAASSEESAAAAMELSAQASKMKIIVSRLRTEIIGAISAPDAARPNVDPTPRAKIEDRKKMAALPEPARHVGATSRRRLATGPDYPSRH